MDTNDGGKATSRKRAPAKRSVPEAATVSTVSEPAPAVPALPTLPGLDLFTQAWDYWLDAGQRSILFWDVMRKRGNQFLEHRRAGSPPVLKFNYETVIDGRTLERPVNYALVRILPDAGMAIDPKKRPYVVVDPRAGHGPGIGGSKKDSQIGVALRAGHPVYFVMFFPEPVPGQTIPDIAAAEALFLEHVANSHPKEAGKPVVIGNCQAGWAVAMLSAAHPDVTGPIVINGAPMSYWAGKSGKNPMRYAGGIMGGSWLASFASDLGNGIFDGAHLVSNFENLNPANTLWSKQYNLYRRVDSEEERFLEFERWWGGFFLMNKEEMEFIVQNLFVGNRLQKGGVGLGSQGDVDLHNIRSPIVLFCSDGDNITPPQQALNWIVDAYGSVDEIKLSGQTIVYMLHKDIGHLGIFVSGKVAQREHYEIVDVMQYIEMLPPGLYEMQIEDYDEELATVDPLRSEHIVRFLERSIDDILALDDGREDEEDFASVAQVSQINERLYNELGSPIVRALMNDVIAGVLRESHPLRAQRSFVSDANPLFWPLSAFADMARANRRPVSDDNPFVRLERHVGTVIEDVLNAYRDTRDSAAEQIFKAVYGNMGLEMMLAHIVGEAKDDPNAPAKRRAQDTGRSLAAEKERILANVGKGGFTEALVRIIAAVLLADRAADRREFMQTAEILRGNDKLKDLNMADFHRLFTEQSFILQADKERAIAALPALLPDPRDRMDAFIAAQSIALADLELTPEETAVLDMIKLVLGV